MKPAVFLDRDGVLIEDTGFVRDPQTVRVLPRVGEALVRLQAAGYARVVVTNQSGVARGILSRDDVDRVNVSLCERLREDDAHVDAFYVCPHYDEGCACRKPAPGMIEAAVREHDLTLDGSALVGDRGSDIALARALAIPGILVASRYAYDGPAPDVAVPSLYEAVDWILARG